MGTVPLVNYQTPSAPPIEGYPSEIGWTTSGIPSSDGAATNLYPNLRKIYFYLFLIII